MSNSTKKHVTLEEGLPLNTVPGSGDAYTNGTCSGQDAATRCNERHHRKLAICSIICGISCIGIKALINSVKAENTKDPEAAERYSRQARKFGIISIVTWAVFLASIPLFLAAVSYFMVLLVD